MKGGDNDTLNFRYTVNVDTGGLFSTTLPEDVVMLFKKAGLSLGKNRSHREGYYSSNTLNGLKHLVKSACEEYFSRELIEESIVIQYGINSTYSFVYGKNGDICPNGQNQWTKWDTPAGDGSMWQEGNTHALANDNRAFGVQLYVRPFWKRRYRYKSGSDKTEYKKLTPFGNQPFEDNKEEHYYLHWLQGMPGIGTEGVRHIEEVEYTEETAKFFVEMIKGICYMGEKMKFLSNSENLLKVIEKGQGFRLGPTEQKSKTDDKETT